MKADPKAEAAAPKASKKKLIVIILMAALIVGGGGGAAWFFTQAKADPNAHKEVNLEPPIYAPIESFTVNLQPENGDQYLQVQITLQVGTLQQVELIKSNMPKVRSRVLLLLSGKKASEITSVEGKRQLSSEIIAALKQPFVDKGQPQQINDVLYTTFIIQ